MVGVFEWWWVEIGWCWCDGVDNCFVIVVGVNDVG